MKVNDRISYINKRLKEISEEAKTSSKAMKDYLRVGYKLLLEERSRLIKTLEKTEQKGQLEL